MPSNNYYKVAMRSLQRAIEGRAKGIPFPVKALNEAMLGILPSSYTLWAAESNTGKTRILYFLYWFWVVEYCNNPKTDRGPDDVLIYIFAYEMPFDRSLALLSAAYLYVKENMDFSDADIMGLTEKPSPELVDILKSERHKKFLAQIEYQTRFITDKNPTRALNKLNKACYAISSPVDDDNQIYEFKNPKQMVIALFDHVGNITVDMGNVDRNAIMKLSKGLMTLRNRYGLTAVPIQQANPGEEPELIPNMRMLRELKDTYIDADTYAGIGSPYKQRREFVATSEGRYYIADLPENGMRGWQDKLIFIGVLKNRYGSIVPLIPFRFRGRQGIIEDAPPPTK